MVVFTLNRLTKNYSKMTEKRQINDKSIKAEKKSSSRVPSQVLLPLLFITCHINMSTVKGIGSFGSTALLVSSMTVSCNHLQAGMQF